MAVEMKVKTEASETVLTCFLLRAKKGLFIAG